MAIIGNIPYFQTYPCGIATVWSVSLPPGSISSRICCHFRSLPSFSAAHNRPPPDLIIASNKISTVLPKNKEKWFPANFMAARWGLAGSKFQGNHKWIGRAVNFPRHQWSWSWPNSNIPSQYSEIMAQFDALKLILTKIQNQTLEPYPDPIFSHGFPEAPQGRPPVPPDPRHRVQKGRGLRIIGVRVRQLAQLT